MTVQPNLRQAAVRLREQRSAIGDQLAAQVRDWDKYAARYRSDPAGFAKLETHALVDYIALLLETGDVNFRHLYVGEKAKQFHDPATDAAERRAREAALLAAERAIFLAALDEPAAADVVNAAFDEITHTMTATAMSEVKALFVGDCLYLDVISFLTAPALADGIRLRPTFITTHDARDIKAKIAALSDETFDVIFFSPFTYSLLDDYSALQRPRVLTNPQSIVRHVDQATKAATDIFDTLADLFDCPLIVHAPTPILRNEGGIRDRLRDAATFPARRAATGRLSRLVKRMAADRNARGQVVHVIDEASVVAARGARAAGRYLFWSDLQHPAAFGAMLAPYYRDIVMVVGRMRKRKLVACDLDNTLWEGVIGEGLGVAHHYDRQAPLLTLKQRGVVLAINSKNDPAKAVWQAPAGKLALDDFVSRQINWDPKPLNMRRIAEHLNLKEKDFVFIDDRADERALVQESYPQMLTLDALDPRSWRLLSLWADLLPSKPGADRTDFYRQRDARQAFIASEAEVSAEERAETYGKLELTLTIREAGSPDLDRVADLINRTNQFNMTGARISRRELEALSANDDAWILIADAADRFGAMGTISVLVAQREAGRLAIPYFVLSCRVFGYGMEFAILEAARTRAGPDAALFGRLVETPFNQPCRSVYAEAGFTQSEDGWERSAAVPIAVPAWLAVESRNRSDAVPAE